MSILTRMQSMNESIISPAKLTSITLFFLVWAIFLSLYLTGCAPKERIVLKRVKDVVADASAEPTLKAVAVFYNPNNMRMRLRKIKIDVYINGKKSAEVDQDLKILIPARGEFSIPLEVKLAMKELGLLDTIFGMIGGRKMDIHYKGSLKLNYKGVPVNVPVDYKDEVRIRL